MSNNKIAPITTEEFKEKIKNGTFVKDIIIGRDMRLKPKALLDVIEFTAADPQTHSYRGGVSYGSNEFSLDMMKVPTDFILVEMTEKKYRFNTTLNTITVSYINDVLANIVEGSTITETLTVVNINKHSDRLGNWIDKVSEHISEAIVGNWKFMEKNPEETLKAFDKMIKFREDNDITYDEDDCDDIDIINHYCGECDACEYSERCADSDADPKDSVEKDSVEDEEPDDQDLTIVCKSKEEYQKVLEKIKNVVKESKEDFHGLWDKLSQTLETYTEEDIDKTTDDEIDDSEVEEAECDGDCTICDKLCDIFSSDEDEGDDDIDECVNYIEDLAESITDEIVTPATLILLHNTKAKVIKLAHHNITISGVPMELVLKEKSGITPINILKKDPKNTPIGAIYQIYAHSTIDGSILFDYEFDYSKKTLSDISINTYTNTTVADEVKDMTLSSIELTECIYTTIADDIQLWIDDEIAYDIASYIDERIAIDVTADEPLDDHLLDPFFTNATTKDIRRNI